ncbi:MAG: hypothetical protein N838_29730 [Thiohalocapsa sp. PB-PSB1]|nr:MAG: hypothetical protein N838_29730 [Thiohalocapsa sp. PB-PSB1]
MTLLLDRFVPIRLADRTGYFTQREPLKKQPQLFAEPW